MSARPCRWIVLPLMAAALAGGCGGIGQNVDEDMRELLGQPLDRLIGIWGPPAEERVAAGKRLVTWELGTGGKICNTTVQVNDKNIVTGYYWDGNGCGAAAARL